MAIADRIKRRLGKNSPTGDVNSGDKQDFLRDAADMGEERLERYRLFDDYYDGEHRAIPLQRAREVLERSGLRYTENFCETVVDVMVERMSVEGFQVEDNEEASDWLTKTVWPRNRMDETQGVVHTETTKKGDGFLIVTFDEDRNLPRFTWNRPEIIRPVYADDDSDELLYASKTWTTRQVSPTNPSGLAITRLNLYYPDRVEKWFTVGSAGAKSIWSPHVDPADLDENGAPKWPIAWTMDGQPDGEPIGIPVIHFRNKPKGRTFGRSELRNVLPQQDLLTKQLLDQFYVMDAQGWPQRWATGIPEDTSINVAIGEFLKTANDEAKFGQFDAADPGPMGEAVESTLRRIASRSQTPLYLLMMSAQLPSGESLKTAESPLIHKVQDRETTHGGSWASAMRMGARVTEAFGTNPHPIDPEAEIVTLWADAQSRNEQVETNTLGVQVELLGLSKTTALRKLGYDPDEEATLRAEEQADAPDEPEAPPPPDAPVVKEPDVPAPSPPPKVVK
ncbi:MAG: phage portal protein [Solirubrobacteraceae bacterium]